MHIFIRVAVLYFIYKKGGGQMKNSHTAVAGNPAKAVKKVSTNTVYNKIGFKKAMKRYWPLYLMLLPGLLWFLIFKYLPMLGIVISFKDFSIDAGIFKSAWANPWYKHFAYFFKGPYAKQIIGNTIIISMYKIVFGMLPPLLLAILINECRNKVFGRVVQTLTYLPHFLSWVIIYGILIAFFSESSGLVNRLLANVGLHSIPAMTSPKLFRGVLVGSDIWQSAGWGAIIYLSAMSAIDPSLYEAAKIDGAGRFRCIFNITLPHLTGVFVLLLIMRLGSILNAGFDQIYILSNPQVSSVSEILDTWVFKEGLQNMNYSLASAVGLFKSVIGLVFVTTANKIARKWEYGLW